MGTDIYSYVETQDDDGRWHQVTDLFPLDEIGRAVHKKGLGDSPFDWRSYGMYAFLAGVRNYSAIQPISDPRGLPTDLSPELAKETDDDDSLLAASWLTVEELLVHDYDQVINDRRLDGGRTGGPGEGTLMPLREFLGESFFRDLDILKGIGDPARTRVTFWFDC
jgi:hypothetical protein